MPPSDVEVIDLTLSESSEEEDGDESISEEGSENSEEENLINAETRALLRNAISTVAEAHLRQVLDNLIVTNPAVEVALTKEFVTVTREPDIVAPRWEACVHCDYDFDIHSQRQQDECRFHPGRCLGVPSFMFSRMPFLGELEVNYEKFVDWDEDVHGPMDTPNNRRQYPENFTWTCCELDGQGIGCVQGEHKIAVQRKRRREV